MMIMLTVGRRSGARDITFLYPILSRTSEFFDNISKAWALDGNV